MANEKYLPEDDQDLKLAREIGSRLQSRLPISDIDDPLVSPLLSYKQQEYQDVDYEINSSALFDRIEQKIDSASRKSNIQSISKKQDRWILTAAAVILIVALVGIYYLFIPAQPDLLAESYHEVKIVSLDGGSKVTLRPYSKIYLIKNNSEFSHYMLTGEGYFDVVKNPGRKFSVTAGNGKVSVLGTRFILSNWGDMVQVFLEEGSIKLETQDKTESAILKPGHFASITKEQHLVAPQETEKEQFTDWINNELTFRNKPVSYVFSELEQHFNISIEADRETLNTRIGGTLRLDNIEFSLNDLGAVLGGSFESAGDRKYIFVPGDQ